MQKLTGFFRASDILILRRPTRPRFQLLPLILVLGLPGMTVARAGVLVSPGNATLELFMETTDGVSARASAVTDLDTGSGTAASFTPGFETFTPSGSTLFWVDPNNGFEAVPPVSSLTTVGNAPLTVSNGGGGYVTTSTVSAAPLPFLSQSYTSGTILNGLTASSATLTYQFAVVSGNGGSGTANIVVNATGATSDSVTLDLAAVPTDPAASTGGTVSTLAGLTISGGGVPDLVNDLSNLSLCADGKNGLQSGCAGSQTKGTGFASAPSLIGETASETGGFTESGTYSVDLNTLYTVTLMTNLQCEGIAATSSCSASIDPTITVPDGDTLLLSSGFGNGGSANPSGVPEPWSAPLLVLGVAALVLIQWRRLATGPA